jgi:hypothetical protein
MPELGELTRALNDDLNGVRWPEAPRIRERGRQRQRRGRLLAVAVVAAVAVTGIGAAGLTHPSTGSQHPAAPGASDQVEDDPQVDTSAVELAVMVRAVLDPENIGPDTVHMVGSSGEAQLGACAHAVPLGVPDQLQSVEAWFTESADRQVDEEIVAYRPGSAIVSIRDDLPAQLADSCKDTYTPVASGFAGDESKMVALQAPSMPPRVEVFVASRDFLIWLRLAGPFDDIQGKGRQLAQIAVAKLDCAITGQATC